MNGPYAHDGMQESYDRHTEVLAAVRKAVPSGGISTAAWIDGDVVDLNSLGDDVTTLAPSAAPANAFYTSNSEADPHGWWMNTISAVATGLVVGPFCGQDPG